MVLGMLGELNSLVQALTELEGFRCVAARVYAELVDGSSVPRMFLDKFEWLLSFRERDRIRGR